jgi:hypothetical protein
MLDTATVVDPVPEHYGDMLGQDPDHRQQFDSTEGTHAKVTPG